MTPSSFQSFLPAGGAGTVRSAYVQDVVTNNPPTQITAPLHYRLMMTEQPHDAQKRLVISLLRDAAITITKYGWVQGVSWHPARRALDVQGAIAVAGGARKDDFAGRDVFDYVPSGRLPIVLAAWNALDGYLGADPVSWNDNRLRSQSEVVATLNALADLLEAGLGF